MRKKEYTFNFDYTTVKNYKLYEVAKRVLGPIFKILFKLEYKGLENIPKDKNTRYIVAINHTSNLDPIFVSIAKGIPTLHFMAKAEFFQNPFTRYVIEHLNGFPVKRGQGDNSAIEYGGKIIEEGHVMAICPEGKRVKDKNGVPQKAKAGVAVIAKATNASVLPVAIYCNGPMKVGKHITISIGNLISLNDMGLDKEETSPKDIKYGANLVMDNILKLWEAEKNAN